MFLDIHGGCSPPCISVAAVGSKSFFVIFARIVVVSFFRPSSSIFNRHFLFIFLCLNTGEGDSVFICFSSFGTSSIYIYIQIPHQTRHKSIKNYIIVWVRVVAVERTPVIGIIIQSVFFFGVLYYIQSIFFSSRWRLLDSSFPFSSHYALHSNRLYLICISYNNRTQERKRKSP